MSLVSSFKFVKRRNASDSDGSSRFSFFQFTSAILLFDDTAGPLLLIKSQKLHKT